MLVGNMKIAVLLYGQTRMLDISVRSWKFKEMVPTDFYVSTWDKTKVTSGNLNRTIEYEVTREDILKYLPDATIDICNEGHILSGEPYNKGADVAAGHYISKTYKAMFHIKNSCRMMIESKKEYDLVILTRTDIWTEFRMSLGELKKLNVDNTIFGLTENKKITEDRFYICDTFFIGNTYTMIKMIQTAPTLIDGMHEGLSKHLYETGIEVVCVNPEAEIAKIECPVVRPNCYELPDNEINLVNIHIKSEEWGANH